MEACALNHQFWKSDPPATSTDVTRPSEINVPNGEIIENATAQSGIETNITAIVTGGWNVAGKDLIPVFLSLSISI